MTSSQARVSHFTSLSPLPREFCLLDTFRMLHLPSTTFRLLSVSRHFTRPLASSNPYLSQRNPPRSPHLFSQLSSMSQPSVPADPSASGANSAATRNEPTQWDFPVSQIPANPLGEGRYIKTAAALIIGCVFSFTLIIQCCRHS